VLDAGEIDLVRGQPKIEFTIDDVFSDGR